MKSRYAITAGALYADITADATAGKAIIVPYACEVIDVIAQARATNASGTATVRKATSAISDAVAMATNNAIDRATTINDANSQLVAGDNLNVITNGAADRGLVTILVRWL